MAAIFKSSIVIFCIEKCLFLTEYFSFVSLCQSERSYNLRKARNSRIFSGLSSNHDATFSLSSSETSPLIYRCSNCSMNIY